MPGNSSVLFHFSVFSPLAQLPASLFFSLLHGSNTPLLGFFPLPAGYTANFSYSDTPAGHLPSPFPLPNGVPEALFLSPYPASLFFSLLHGSFPPLLRFFPLPAGYTDNFSYSDTPTGHLPIPFTLPNGVPEALSLTPYPASLFFSLLHGSNPSLLRFFPLPPGYTDNFSYSDTPVGHLPSPFPLPNGVPEALSLSPYPASLFFSLLHGSNTPLLKSFPHPTGYTANFSYSDTPTGHLPIPFPLPRRAIYLSLSHY